MSWVSKRTNQTETGCGMQFEGDEASVCAGGFCAVWELLAELESVAQAESSPVADSLGSQLLVALDGLGRP